jgi:hypothetical protein
MRSVVRQAEERQKEKRKTVLLEQPARGLINLL